MAEFNPVNSLEIKLRDLLTGKDGRIWQFLTPLAAAPLWIIAKHYPELDGSPLAAPAGQNPEICVFGDDQNRAISLYTSEECARKGFAHFKLSPVDFECIHAQGYPLLKWLHTACAEDDHMYFWINCGVENAAYHLDRDMIEILLKRPEPPPADAIPPTEQVDFYPSDVPLDALGPVRDFLAGAPGVRGAFIFGEGPGKFNLALVMVDPEDDSARERVTLILKAVTPVETEWVVSKLMAPDDAYRRIAEQRPPFYAAPGFLG